MDTQAHFRQTRGTTQPLRSRSEEAQEELAAVQRQIDYYEGVAARLRKEISSEPIDADFEEVEFAPKLIEHQS